MKDKEPFIQLEAFKNAVFTLGDNSREFNLLELIELSDLIRSHLKITAEIFHYLKYYQNFLTKIDGILDNIESEWNEDDIKEYQIGEDFAWYLGATKKLKNHDNHTAGEIIKKDYETKFPKHSLLFDSEYSYCYVYTKDRKEAERFLKFTYNKFIYPALKPWYTGFEEFQKTLDNATQKQKQKFNLLKY